MAYATYSDVQVRVRSIGLALTSVSIPTQDQVTAFIAQYEAELNSVLRGIGYPTIPATQADDVTLFQGKVANRAAIATLRVAIALDTDVLGSLMEELNGWRQFLDDLQNNRIILVGSPASHSSQMRIVALGRRDAYGDGSEYTSA